MSTQRGRGAWSPKHTCLSLLAALLVLGAPAREVKAILVYGPQGRNLTEPTDPGQAQAWQFEGVWQNHYLATPIAPNYFITSTHIGGNIGDIFNSQGVAYTTTAVYQDPNSHDLEIWKFNGNLPSTAYAAPYSSSDEQDQTLITFGQGGARGNSYSFEGTQRGWQFTLPDKVMSWGTNQVDYAGNLPDGTPAQYLAFKFDATRGPNTASLSPGDSGGGVFIQSNGVWKLAGINYAVDGPYYTVPPADPHRGGTLITGAMFDQRGLYVGDASSPIPDPGTPVPAYSYATRVSSEFTWIVSVTGVPEPSSVALIFCGIVFSGMMFGKKAIRGRANQAKG